MSFVDGRIDLDVFVPEIQHWLYRGDTPLHLAAAALDTAAATDALAAGADVAAVNRRGATALHYACDPRRVTGDAQPRMISLLIEYGAPVNAADKAGVTALHRATRARSPRAVAALLAAGADPLARTGQRGSTPLLMAVTSTGAGGTAGTFDEQVEICRLLLAAGASLNETNNQGATVSDRIRSPRLRSALTPS